VEYFNLVNSFLSQSNANSGGAVNLSDSTGTILANCSFTNALAAEYGGVIFYISDLFIRACLSETVVLFRAKLLFGEEDRLLFVRLEMVFCRSILTEICFRKTLQSLEARCLVISP
jgi:hypothetical protein